MNRFKVISGSSGTTHSGSIYKVQALEASTFRIEFSKVKQQDSTEYETARSITDNIALPAGFTIEAPMGRVKILTGGSLIFMGEHGT